MGIVRIGDDISLSSLFFLLNIFTSNIYVSKKLISISKIKETMLDLRFYPLLVLDLLVQQMLLL